jgi:hypothetical protein
LFTHPQNEQILKNKKRHGTVILLIFLGGSPKNPYSKISNSPMPCANETKHEDYAYYPCCIEIFRRFPRKDNKYKCLYFNLIKKL